MKKLGDVIEVLSGFAFDSKHFSTDKGIPLIRIRDVVRGYSKTFYQGKYNEAYLVKQGDILIGMDGEFNIARWQAEPALLNQRVCKISASCSKTLNSQYLYYALPKKLKEIEDRTPFVTVKHLSVKDVKNVDIPLPPLHIQEQIADTLDKADALRQKDQQLSHKYDELAQSIFYDMFGNIITNERKWRIVNLKDLGEWRSGGTPLRSRKEYFDGNIPWLSSGELNEMYITDSREHISFKAIEESASKLIPSGSLMLGMYDTAALKSCISVGALTCNQAIAFSKLNDNLCSTEFVYFYIQQGKEHLRSQQRGVRQKNMNLSMIKNLKVPLPPRSKQKDFALHLQKVQMMKKQVVDSQKKSNNLWSFLQNRFFS